MEDRLSQMDQRIAALAAALRQQDDLSQRMQAALDEVMAKTAALPMPRSAPGPTCSMLAHDASPAVDAGAMVVPDPTLGGGGVGGGGMGGVGGGFGGHGVMLQGGGLGVPVPAGAGDMMAYEDEDDGGDDDDVEEEEAVVAAAGAGLEVLAGMEAVAAEDLEANAGVGEAGLVTVPGRGMKQVSLQLRYREPIVIACIVPNGPQLACSPSPDGAPASGLGGGLGGGGGFSASALAASRSPSKAPHQSVVCVPFKGSSAFTVQLLPPVGTDVQVAYVVVEAGPHTLEGGARIIAGEAALNVQESQHLSFDRFVVSSPGIPIRARSCRPPVHAARPCMLSAR